MGVTISFYDVILSIMTSSTNNIEAVARDICTKQFARHGGCVGEITTSVDRYWHCVAAELEAGLIDDSGDPWPDHSFEEGLEAYRDWCQRHPETKPS
jgi:hypothetical protein